MHQVNVQSHAARGARKRFDFVALPAVLAIVLGWGSVAAARTDSIRWTHEDSDLAGFRVYSSATANGPDRTLVEDLTLAEAGPNSDGVYFYLIGRHELSEFFGGVFDALYRFVHGGLFTHQSLPPRILL